MRDPVTCPHCKHAFEPGTEQLGGLIACPTCGRVVDVPGLHDPLWQLGRIGVVVFAVALGLWFGRHEPWHGAAATGAVLAIAWLLRFAF